MLCVFQEVWACWCELLSYLEQENSFLDQLEQKLDETENLQGGAEELQEALDVSRVSQRWAWCHQVAYHVENSNLPRRCFQI